MMTPYLCSGMMLVTILACNGLLADYCAGARRALAVRFSQACGQNMFGLSYETVLGAVRACCDAGEATLEWLAAATGAGTLISQCGHGFMPISIMPISIVPISIVPIYSCSQP